MKCFITISMMTCDHNRYTMIKHALKVLGKKNLVFIIHDASFPGLEGEDTGRGSPYSKGAESFCLFLKNLGFTGVQLGPQGLTTAVNPSPYDGTVFSKNPLSIDVKQLTDPQGGFCGILDSSIHRQMMVDIPEVTGSDTWVDYKRIFAQQGKALNAAFRGFKEMLSRMDDLGQDRKRSLCRMLADYRTFTRQHSYWLQSDALFEALSAAHRTDNWRLWDPPLDRRFMDQAVYASPEGKQRVAELRRQFSEIIEFYAFCQFAVHHQHGLMQQYSSKLGLKMFGDLQVGYSCRDEWVYREVFLEKYRMGAPPSRTNPEGQPWNYPLYDPEKLFGNGSLQALALVLNRVGKMLKEFDGIRIDHPHGLVDPWGYRTDEPDPVRAVQNGARILSSPCLPGHPDLEIYAIAKPENINPDAGVPPHADNWVISLDREQVDRYDRVISGILKTARKAGRRQEDILCEVLSTMPYPLRRVIEKHAMGRFRVSQKADPENPADVYRCENAAPGDWVMMGNHDTKPVWLVVDEWFSDPDVSVVKKRADYLASQLSPDGADREAFSKSLLADPGAMVHAMAAQLFASPAENVMVFFADLFGIRSIYNEPGIVNSTNWHLRVPNNYSEVYSGRLPERKALSIPRALCMAMQSKGRAFRRGNEQLLRGLALPAEAP